MSLCFRRNLQISGFSAKVTKSRTKLPKIPKFPILLARSNRMSESYVLLKSQLNRTKIADFLLLAKFQPILPKSKNTASETQKQARSYRNAKATNLLKSQLNRTTDSRVIRKFVKSVGCPHSSHSQLNLCFHALLHPSKYENDIRLGPKTAIF